MRRAFAAAFLLAPLAAPALAGSEQVYFKITFQDATVARSVSKVDSFAIKQTVTPYKLDRVYVKSWSTSGDAAPPQGFPSGVAVHKGGGGSGQGFGSINRLTAASIYAPGLCAMGRRFASATMTGGGKSYTFRDVRITGCVREGPREKITFVYGTLR